MAGKLSPKKKRLATLAKKTAEQKDALLEHLAKCCIVQAACERTGVGRSTYYKWYAEDDGFRNAADKAFTAGRAYLNDVAISGLLKLIQEGSVGATIFWLKNNHMWFAEKIRHEHEHRIIGVGDGVLTPEQREQLIKAQRLSGMTAAAIIHEELKEKFLASKKGQETANDVDKSPTNEAPDDDRISDWGTGKPAEKFNKELERNGINIQEFLRNRK